MKKIDWKHVLGAGLLSIAMMATAGAQGPPVPPNYPAPHPHYDQQHPYATRFGDFLDSHPGIEADLSKNPKLATNHKYLEQHSDLRHYLHEHPDVDAQLHEDPYKFMHRVHHTQ